MMKRMTMHPMRTAVLALCTVGLSALPTLAQDAGAPPPPREGQRGPGGPGGGAKMQERQLEMMKTQLNLTDEQVSKVTKIQADERSQMMALRDDTATPIEQKRDKMKTIRETTHHKIMEVLTKEQKEKYKEMEEKMREQGGNRREPGGGQGEGAPPPPPPQ